MHSWITVTMVHLPKHQIRLYPNCYGYIRHHRCPRRLLSFDTQAHDKQEGEGRTHDALKSLAVSRYGLDPTQNRFHAPIVYHENYSFASWPRNHTFPMHKFAATANALLTHSNQKLPRPLVRKESHFFRPLEMDMIPEEWITAVICPDFFRRFRNGKLTEDECRWICFREQTRKPELIERTLLEVAGTILTCQLAFQWGLATNIAGGTHHASRDRGAGYTIINDLAVASNFVLSEVLNGGTIRSNSVLVIDCDVHQGDGTAKFVIEGLSTLSIHCEDNYPRPKATSTYDVGLPSNTKDDDYMKALRNAVLTAFDEVKPDFVIYDAGIDVYEKDVLGKLLLSENGIRMRDRWVLDACVSRRIPVAAVVGGGYDKDINLLGRRHSIIHEEAAFIWRKHHMFHNRSGIKS